MIRMQAAAVQQPKSRRERRRAKKLERKSSPGDVASMRPGDDVVKLWETARHQMVSKDMAAAEASLRNLVALRPDMHQFQYALGVVLLMDQRPQLAYEPLKQAVSLSQDNAHYWSQLARCLVSLKLFDAAIIAYRNVIAREPENAAHHIELASALRSCEQITAALDAFDAAIAIKPDHEGAHFGKGTLYEFMGDFSNARACYARALEINPDHFEVYVRLADMNQSLDDSDKVIAKLEEGAKAVEISAENKSVTLFAAAKIRHREKRYDEAFGYYLSANTAMKEKHPCDREAMVAAFDETISAFTPDVFKGLQDTSNSSKAPVFVVGMPRSGTTLTEQILSSHSRAAGAGELMKMDQIAGTLSAIRNGELRYPRDVARIAPENLDVLGQEYLSELRARAGTDAARIVDKNVFNFLNLGLIAILFPKASIIHCRRDPMDCGLSCFFQNFAGAMKNPFWFDLEDIGLYYRQHDRLMAHWHSVLPMPIHEVIYEDLVENQEAVSRRMVDFIGLEWDDACLNFHENKRVVSTASVWQVRQPVYKSSAGRWRHYEEHLDPLKRGLGIIG